jgi:Ca2+-binding RTX toxin-like protein
LTNLCISVAGGHKTVVGNGNDTITVFGSGTVIAGNGRDAIDIKGKGNVTVGSGSDTVTVEGDGTVHSHDSHGKVDVITIYGDGSVKAGNGNDTITIGHDGKVKAGDGNDLITIHGKGHITVGGGNDTLTLYGPSGKIVQHGSHGHDTIVLGTGDYTIKEQGHATVWGANNNDATIVGGEIKILHKDGVTEDFAISGKATLVGGSNPTEFVAGSGYTVMRGGTGDDTFVGGSGHDTMHGGLGSNVFEFLASEQGGKHVITNFVAGQDHLYVEGHSLSYLQSQGDIHTHGGSTYISIDGGKTTIELQGVTSLKASDFNSHK